MQTDILIIGAGPIGLFAIFQAGMLGMKAHIIDSLEEIGGQCTALYPEKPIYDIPAYPQIQSANLINKLAEQALPFNPIYHLGQQAIKLEIEDRNFKVTTSKNSIITAKVLIIAAGAGCFGANKPPLVNIEAFEGKSIFYFVHNINDLKNKTIIIAGGGDSALDWAITLSSIAKKIYLLHRRDKFRGAEGTVRKMRNLVEAGLIELVIGYQLEALMGQNGVLEAVIVKDFVNNQKILPADILLPFFGLTQDLGPIKNWNLNIKANHILVKPPYFETNIPNIYAVGDIATYEGKLKLILTGFAEVASALHHSYAKVFDNKALHFEYSTNKGVNIL